jgi:hypothetical protein
MNNKLLSGVVAGVLALSSSAAFATAQDEVDKQVAKMLADAITKRVAATVVAKPTAAVGAQVEPNSAYGSYSNLRSGFTTAALKTDSRTNIFIGGYDRSLSDKLILGAAANGGDTSNTLSTGVASPDSNFTGIQPYLAYIFTENFFVIANAGFSRFSTTGTDGDTTSYGLSLNAAKRFEDFVLKGRLEGGGSRGSFTTAGVTTSSSTTQHKGDIEAGFFFAPTLYGYVGYQATGTNKANSNTNYARIGLEHNVNKNAAVALGYESMVNDSLPAGTSMTAKTWTLSARIKF